MLTPDQCRAIDPDLASLSDDELTTAVELLTRLAELLLDDWLAHEGSKYRRGVLDNPDAPSMIDT
jgi:hypothetical protein